MVTKVIMPRLSLTMKEGTVVQWFKKEGDAVNKGEPLVEVLSEKVTYDVEAPESGILHRILASEGSNVPIDQAIGIIGAPNEAVMEVETMIPIHPSQTEPEASIQIKRQDTERVLASPAAKRLARELNLDLALVKGTGPEGRIVEQDVRHFAEQAFVKPKVREIVPLAGIRRTTAERLVLSATTVPHSTITMEVDMSNAVRLHEEKSVSYTDMLVKAVAIALREHPQLNSTLESDQIRIFEDVNIGVAVATEKGLLVPVVHNADKKTFTELRQTLDNLIEKAKLGKLTRQDLTGGTFTITSLGMYGVDVFIPIINPPEAAILGVGRITQKPVMVDKELETKQVMHLSLAFDHRIIDGAPAAEFLQKVKETLEGVSNQFLN